MSGEKKRKRPDSENEPCETAASGMNAWVEAYSRRRRDEEELRVEVATFMAQYDAEQEEMKRKARNEPDEEGWITVTRTKKSKPKRSKLQTAVSEPSSIAESIVNSLISKDHSGSSSKKATPRRNFKPLG